MFHSYFNVYAFVRNKSKYYSQVWLQTLFAICLSADSSKGAAKFLYTP